MLAFHLRHAFLPRLLTVAGVTAVVLWIGFRPGGTEVGDTFGVWALARFWVVLTPIIVVLVVSMLGRTWDRAAMLRSWALTQPSRPRAIRDRLSCFLAGYLVYAAFVGVLFLYAASRLEQTGPVAYLNLVTLTVAGPVIGGYWVMAAAYATKTPAARIVIVVLLAVLDAINQLPFNVLSISGTSGLVDHRGAWAPPLADAALGSVLRPEASFLIARLVLAACATLLVAATAPVPGRPSGASAAPAR